MQPFTKDFTFAIIGAGRVGVTLGVLLERAGHKITGCSARTSASLERAARFLRCPSSTDALEVLGQSDGLILAVPDDALSPLVASIKGHVPPETYVVHAAGSRGLDVLEPLAEDGCETFAIHVLQSVPTVDAGLERVPGSWFGVTCADEARQWAEDYVGVLGGKVWWVAEEDRVTYHACAAIASNFLTVLAALVEEVGLDVMPYVPLMQGTLSNVAELGALKALTGPIIRGDSGTVLRHVLELEQISPEIASAYRAFSSELLRAASRAGRVTPESAKSIREVIEKEE